MSSATIDDLPISLAVQPIVLPHDLPMGGHLDFVQAGADFTRVGTPPDGLAVAVHVHPMSPGRLLLRLSYFFRDRQVERDARSRAAARIRELKAPLDAVSPDGRPEQVAYFAAKEAADKARADVAAAEGRLADLRREYDALLDRGENPVVHVRAMTELTLEAGAYSDFARRLEEKESDAKVELDQVVQAARDDLWRAAEDREWSRLADTRAKLYEDAAVFASRLAGQMLELDATGKLLAGETPGGWVGRRVEAAAAVAQGPPAAEPVRRPRRQPGLGPVTIASGDRTPGIGPMVYRDD